MPDITMCLNQECPNRNKFYYFMAIPLQNRQAYSNLMKGKDMCDNFYPIEKRMRIRENETVNKPIRIEL